MPFEIRLSDPPSLCRRTSIESHTKSDHLTLPVLSAENRSNAIRNQIGPSFPLPPNLDRQPDEIRSGLPPLLPKIDERHSKSDRKPFEIRSKCKKAIVYVPSVPRVRRFTYPRFRGYADLRTLGTEGTQIYVPSEPRVRSTGVVQPKWDGSRSGGPWVASRGLAGPYPGANKLLPQGPGEAVEGKHFYDLFGPSTVPDLKLSNICNSRLGPLLGN